jgi:hypothetical protein
VSIRHSTDFAHFVVKLTETSINSAWAGGAAVMLTVGNRLASAAGAVNQAAATSAASARHLMSFRAPSVTKWP